VVRIEREQPADPLVGDTHRRSPRRAGSGRPTGRWPALPCFPCPHRSACCFWGTDLSEIEAEALGCRYGYDKLRFDAEGGGWRTRVVGHRCVFLGNNCCLIHDDPHYPAVCREFPWADAETGGPYRGELEACPEFVLHPELRAALRPDEAEDAATRHAREDDAKSAWKGSLRPGRPMMEDDDRRQKRREAALKGAQTKGKARLREIALKRAQTMGKEALQQAALKGNAKRSPEERSQAARKGAETRRRNWETKKSAGEAPGS
jgi:hypothetical protein